MRKHLILTVVGGFGSLLTLALVGHFGIQTSTAAADPMDACVIALAETSGREGESLSRLRAQARNGANAEADLERLGWAYVAEARRTFDPGYYTLADRAAQCLEQRAGARPAARLLRGHAAYSLHDFATAEALARALVAERGSAADHALLGDALMERGHLDGAREAYDASLARGGRATALARLAHLRWLRGDLAAAADFMRQAVARTRQGEAAVWMRVRLALYDWQAGRDAAAMRNIERTLILAPGYAPALLAKGRMLLAQDRNAVAVVALREAAIANPTPEYRWALIEALHAAGRSDEAGREESILIERGAAEDRRTLALYLATTARDPDLALRLAQAELALRTDVHTLDAVAWALNAAGRAEEAHAFMRKALPGDTADPRLFFHAAVIAAATDHRDEARLWLGKAAAAKHLLLPSERARLAEALTTLDQPPTE